MTNYKAVDYRNVHITDGFWKDRQELNHHVTAQAVYDRFSDSHRFEALDCTWNEKMKYEPHIYWDSDVAKWMEGAAYVIAQTGDEKLTALVEKAIDAVTANQEETGYFNSYFLVKEKEMRFKNRNWHELYCAGHFMEAACAYYQATGRDRFLKAMCKYADYIYDTFVLYQSASFMTPGHPEIELALVKLYDVTGNEKYLELSKFFLDMRGRNVKDTPISSTKYNAQDHLPITEQTTPEGHSVRAMYLFCGAADIARRCHDEAYRKACEAVFDSTVSRRMYITGGIGSTNLGEAFTTDYFLPNDTAYTETCAAISLAMFASRMTLLHPDAKYADVVERVLYNGFLSGVSLDGKSFFYTNPLEIDPNFASVNTSTANKRYVPIMQRVELFSCSCCPPNVFRFVASLGGLLYTHSEDTLYVHQFAESTAHVNGATITQSTAYPVDGTVSIRVAGERFAKIAVRIPGWCPSFSANRTYEMQNGYAVFAAGEDITLHFAMDVALYQANANVQNNAGCVAVARGPVVYCMEEVDNGRHLKSLLLGSRAQFTVKYNELFHLPTLHTTALRKKEQDSLYALFSDAYETVPVTFIPYYAFANRGVSEMLVWAPVYAR